jgi:hypothetical protein
MSKQKQQSVEVDSIQVLLHEAKKTSRRVYNNAIAFLVLGLLVASAGVLYFYFSNDAIFLDRAFYEDKISELKANNASTVRDFNSLNKLYRKQLVSDSALIRTTNRSVRLGKKVFSSYIDLYNAIIDSDLQTGNSKARLKYIIFKSSEHDNLIEIFRAGFDRVADDIDSQNKSREEALDVIRKFQYDLSNPIKPEKSTNAYDKPELVFSPKLVYGFLSRIGGLIFIELIAFYLLKQYRVTINDFKYYNSVLMQVRANLFLVQKAEMLDDNKQKIEIISKIFNNESIVHEFDDKDNSDIGINSTDIDSLKKLFDSIKELIKK